MSKNVTFWIAFLIIIASAVYQRATGPTYPISASIQIENNTIKYKFARSHGSINGSLQAFLPHQLSARKLEYYIELKKDNFVRKLSQNNSVFIGFNDDVPLSILIPHRVLGSELDYNKLYLRKNYK